jgi:hypothetical protein
MNASQLIASRASSVPAAFSVSRPDGPCLDLS